MSKRSLDSSGSEDTSEVKQILIMENLDKKPKKAIKKSKKLESDDDDEEFATKSKIEPIESKRTRKSTSSRRFYDDDADLTLALQISLAEATKNKEIKSTKEETVVLEIENQNKDDTNDTNEPISESKQEINLDDSSKKKKKATPRKKSTTPAKKSKKIQLSDDDQEEQEASFTSDSEEESKTSKKKSKKTTNSTKKKTVKSDSSSVKKRNTSKSNNKKEIEQLDEVKLETNVEIKKSAQVSLNFNQVLTKSEEDKEEIKLNHQVEDTKDEKEGEDEEEYNKENKQDLVESKEDEEEEEIVEPKPTFIKGSKVLELNEKNKSKSNVTGKFNSPSIVKPSKLAENIQSDSSSCPTIIKHTPPLVRIGLSRNSKIKPLHPNAKINLN